MIQDERNLPIHLAIVEDHPMVQAGILSAMEKHKAFHVDIMATSGGELLTALEEGPLPDICLTDISLPDMEAFELVPLVRERWPEIKILILTGYDRWEGYVTRLAAMGINGYLSKRVPWEELADAIRTIYDRGYYFSGGFTPRLMRSAQSGSDPGARITPMERTFLRLSARGLDPPEIAAQMHKTKRSVEGYRYKLALKLGSKNRGDMLSIALRNGYIKLEDFQDPEDHIF